jgi:fatty-acyl-CoA synthase
MSHPKIKEAAVIAIPDEKWMEKPLASIVPADPDDKPTDEELMEFLSRDFAKYQVPRDYVFINEVPKTSVGKFDKKEIRKLYAEGRL